MTPEDFRSASSIDDETEIQVIRHYFLIIWRRTWLILLVGVNIGIITYFISRQMTPVYQTSTSVLVQNAPNTSESTYSSVQASQSLASTYASILTQDAMLSEVISRLGLSSTSSDLANSIKVTPNPSTQLITITVKGTDQISIANIANTLVKVLIDKIMSTQTDRYTSSKDNLQSELNYLDGLIQTTTVEKDNTQDLDTKARLESMLVQYRQMYANLLANFEQVRLAEVQSTSNIVQISPAGLSYTVASPKVFLLTALTALMSMFFVASIVLIQDALDNTINTAEEIPKKLHLPVIGVIYSHNYKNNPVTIAEPQSTSSEAFRMLGNKIRYTGTDKPIRSIMITSPTKAEGKSTVSVNLGIVLAQAGNNVVVIDANFSHPVDHDFLQLSNKVGLSELLLLGQTGLSKDGVLQKYPTESLYLISSGTDPSEKKHLLVSKNFNSILSALINKFKIVVIDTAPLMKSADTLTLSTLVDGLVLVVQSGQTTLTEARQAIENLGSVNAPIIGVVINGVTIRDRHHWRNFRF